MAACRSLQHIFEKPLSENPKIFESLSSTWSPIKSMAPIGSASFAELFGELQFKDKHEAESHTPTLSASPPSSSSSSSSTFSDSNNNQLVGIDTLSRDNDERNKIPHSPTCYYSSRSSPKKAYRQRNSLSSMSSEGLSHCTEGLGFESSDEVEEAGNDNVILDWRNRREEKQGANVVQEHSEYMYCDRRRSRINRSSFPPPISCIGANGRPFVSFKSYRENGRFILKEVRIPQQEFLRASRENGRLQLELVHSDDDYDDYDEDESDDDDDDDESFDVKDTKEVVEDMNEDNSFNQEEEESHVTNVVDEEHDEISNDIQEIAHI